MVGGGWGEVGCLIPLISCLVPLVAKVAKYLNKVSHHYLGEAEVST